VWGRASSGVPRNIYRHDFGVLRVPMLAGWLFADLFLVLFIVAFASQPSAPLSKPKVPTSTHSPTPSAAPSPSPTLSPSPSPKPASIGLEQTPQNIVVQVSPIAVDNPATRAAALVQLISSLHKQLASLRLTGGTAGFVIIFATSVTDNPDPVDEADKVADSVLPVLKTQDAALFGRASGEGFWGGANGNYFHFQIFFFKK
jgi:hypothetical protein